MRDLTKTDSAEKQPALERPALTDSCREVSTLDLKAFASAVDAVEKDLRALINGEIGAQRRRGSPTGKPERSGQSEHTPKDDEDRESLVQRLLLYRYKRRISDPPQPLEPLATTAPVREVSGTDKIERNMRKSRLSWFQNRPEKVKKANEEQEQRLQIARQRREEAQRSFDRQMAAKDASSRTPSPPSGGWGPSGGSWGPKDFARRRSADANAGSGSRANTVVNKSR